MANTAKGKAAAAAKSPAVDAGEDATEAGVLAEKAELRRKIKELQNFHQMMAKNAVRMMRRVR